MKHENERDSQKPISLEEYLEKRQKLKEKEFGYREKSPTFLQVELYV